MTEKNLPTDPTPQSREGGEMVVVSTTDVDHNGEHIEALISASELNGSQDGGDIDHLAAEFQNGFTHGNMSWEETPEYHRDFFREGVRCLLSKLGTPTNSYQDRVAAAHHALFHGDPTDIAERNARGFEESIETAQAFGMTKEEAMELVEYTFSRPVGEPAKELGAKILTAFSLAVVAGIDAMEAAEADLEKLQRPETIARIRAKRATRHGRGPLPGFDPAATEAGK